MYRKMLGIIALVIIGTLATACSRNTGENGTVDTPTPAVTEAVTPTVTPTATVTPTPTTAAEVTPTEEVTPTKGVTPTEGPLDLVALAAKSRELHEKIVPKTTANPFGTSPAYTEQDKKDYESGIERNDGANLKSINLLTGEEASWDDHECVLTRIYGLKNAEVQRKVNERVETVVRTMMSEEYLPNVSGIMAIVKERGLPDKKEVECGGRCDSGIYSVAFCVDWIWYEDMTFEDALAAMEYTGNAAWVGNGENFFISFTDSLDFDLSPLNITVKYGIREMIYLNFDLRTGEEISLSDIFPEGFDYLTYMNREVQKLSAYDFWFDDYEYQQSGERKTIRTGDPVSDRYQDRKEYDGGLVLADLTGDEMFFISGSYVEITTNRGDRLSVKLPYMLANRDQGDYLFAESGGYYKSSLGLINICDFDTDGPIDPKEIGSFRTSLNGKDKINVEVYRGDMTLFVDTLYDRKQALEEEWLPYFTDKKIVELAEQCLTLWENPTDPKSECKMVLLSVWLYPNGYALADWYVYHVYEEGYEIGYFDDYGVTEIWLKDGKPIRQEELYNVSYEELLAELIANLRPEFGTAGIVDEEKAKTIAKAVMPYFVGVCRPLDSITMWSWDHFMFRWTEDGTVVSGSPFEGDAPSELKDLLPEELWDSLNGKRVTLKIKDAYVIEKHLRMYEGYPFP